MYLKSLKIAGFKSFADRARLEFRRGVTVVVGPNGSGKSNLVDALSWVLGSQSAKSLRTPKMEDVIFAGTATRPALGKAEATLVIDNTERQIDLDLDEVSITRRLYRDGSSDYELNGVGCRLLDIQDLLSDSGVGRHQHVIIGQGEIGRVLNASPEEHRAVIEEAAGILKHRRRKERSERRLERTDEDLIRLQDLLGEISRQMRPLKRQARAAERYESLKAEVVALRLYLSGTEMKLLDRELTMATSERAALVEQSTSDRARTADLSERIGELSAERSDVTSDLERDTSAAARLETTLERLRRIGSVARERRRAAMGRTEALVERRADLSEEAAGIEEELQVIERSREEAESAAIAAESRFRSLDEMERSTATQTSMSPEGALAVARGELSALQASMARDEREIQEIRERLRVIDSQEGEKSEEIDRLDAEIRQLDSNLEGLDKRYREVKADRESLQVVWSEAEATLATARIEKAAARARHEAVESALAGRFDTEARDAVQSAPGALGTLVARLDIPAGLETAVSTALGAWEDAIAFDGPEAVLEAVEIVKGAGGGSVAAVSAISEGTAPAREIAEKLGVDALIDRLGSQRHEGLAARLLGDVVLVEGWASGWSLVSRHPSLRAVTPEGDLISVSGVRIADPEGAGSAMLESASAAVERSATAEARASSVHVSAKRDFDLARASEREALEELEAGEAAIAGRSEAMHRLRTSLSSLAAERERLNGRESRLRDAITGAQEQAKSLERRLAALEGEEAERMAAWEELETERLRLAGQREAARSAWQEASETVQALVERQRLLRSRLERVTHEAARLAEGTAIETDPQVLEWVAEKARAAAEIIERQIEELRTRQAGLREQRDELNSALDGLRSEHDGISARLGLATERVGELDVRLVEIRMRRQACEETLRRDADADVEQALQAPRPNVAEDADLEAILEEKATQLRRLGAINPLAAKEYRELEERHDFLADQMADVQNSRAELRKVIAALDEEIQTRFEAAFDEVSQAYDNYFTTLFPGGRGRIRLVDESDPQSGVSIDAQPLGKKVSQMTLLSGGERSLAALAFLFAVFEARPSPFYVLDEVEAALDDANLRRFLRIVDEFRQRAQLIIVTHQQQTMEAADVLYGVTMEPGGSSQAVRKEMTPVTAKIVA